MINAIHTPCKNCSFAIYEDKTQTNCALEYLAVYNRNNQEVLEVYDDEKEFFVINNKKCPGYRESKWFDSLSENTDTLEDKIAVYHKYNYIDYLLVINLLVLTRQQFIDLCEQISKLSIKPKKIILVRYPPSSGIDTFPYEYLKENIEKYLIGTAWRIQTVVDPSISYEFMLQNITSVNKKHRFIASINGFNKSVSDIIIHANDTVTKKLQSFMIISNSEKSCFIFSSAVYRYSMFMDNKNILLDETNYSII